MVSLGDPPNRTKRHGRQAVVPHYTPVTLTLEERHQRYAQRFRYQLALRNEGKPYSNALLNYFFRGLTGLDGDFEDDDD